MITFVLSESPGPSIYATALKTDTEAGQNAVEVQFALPWSLHILAGCRLCK